MKKCLNCDQALQGRRDKKYCDAHCRSDYHNQMNRHSKIQNINTILIKNRMIIKDLLSNEIFLKVSKTELLQRGLNFRYHTHMHITKENKVYCYAYDFGWMSLDTELILLVREK